MSHLREYDVVRVVRLATTGRSFLGSDGEQRPPRVGDVATICHEYLPGDPAAAVAVEMVNQDGLTVWLADFERSELELVERPL